MIATKRFWMGAVPSHCDLCSTRLQSQFYDSALKAGYWAIVYFDCQQVHSAGQFQHYKLNSDLKWEKIADSRQHESQT